MSAWAVKDATETWQDVCDRAWAGEPQFVSRGSSQTVVVISLTAYAKCGLCSDAQSSGLKSPSLFETLRNCPLGGVELNVERDHTDFGRKVDLS